MPVRSVSSVRGPHRARRWQVVLAAAAAVVLGGCGTSHAGAASHPSADSGQPGTSSGRPGAGPATSTATAAATASSRARGSGSALDCLTATPVTCYGRSQFLAAYGITPLLDRGIDGRGQTVVLPEFAPALAAGASDIRQDLALFDRVSGLSAPHLEVNTQLDSGASPDMAGSEEVGNAEMVHEVAPDAAIQIILLPAFAGAAQATTDEVKALDLAPSLGHVVSITFGLGEQCYTPAEVKEWNAALQTDRDQHVTVVASSGDNGAATVVCNGLTAPAPEKGVNLPASSPLVLAVGGTSLQANRTTGAYQNETAWNTPVPASAPIPADYEPAEASNGGFSSLFSRPSYQDGTAGIAAMRGVPDVAADASPYTGTAHASIVNGLRVIGPSDGTSAGAPFWAAIVALANQYAGHPLGFINPAIYRIGHSSGYHAAFHDITTGGNTVTYSKVTVTGYQAAAGWDPVTGWGSPDAQILVPLLARESS
jgi:subtilase family serine protease